MSSIYSHQSTSSSAVSLWFLAATRPEKARQKLRALSDSQSSIRPRSPTRHIARQRYSLNLPSPSRPLYSTCLHPDTPLRTWPFTHQRDSNSRAQYTPPSSVVSDTSQSDHATDMPNRHNRDGSGQLPIIIPQPEINIWTAADSLRRQNTTVELPPFDRQTQPQTNSNSRQDLPNYNHNQDPNTQPTSYTPAYLDECLNTVRSSGGKVTLHPYRATTRSSSPAPLPHTCEECRTTFRSEDERSDHVSERESYCARCHVGFACNGRLAEHTCGR